jgi:hypothetical protein
MTTRMPRAAAAAALLICLGAAPAFGQGAEFGIGGGSTLPVGDAADFLKNGPHGILTVSFTPDRIPVGLQVTGMYHRISGDEVGDIELPDYQVISGSADALFKFKVSEEVKVRPYLLAGVGLYNLKQVGAQATPNSGISDFGLNGGAGIDFKLGGFGLFLEGRYHQVFTDGRDFKIVPISLGARLGGT